MTDEPMTDADASPGHSAAPRRVDVVAAIAAVAALGGLTIWSRYATGNTELIGLDIAVGVLACVLAPVLVWRPVGGTLGAGLLAALSPAATPAATLGALQAAQRRTITVAITVAATGVAAHAVQGVWRTPQGISLRWWLVLITIGYAAVVGWGAHSRARRALLESLRERARRAEAEQGRRVAEARALERTRLAHDMHDVLAHRLTLLATYAGALEYRPDAPPEQLSRAAGVVRDGVHQALEDLRDVIALLRGDPDATDNGVSRGFVDLPDLVRESTDAGADVTFHNAVTDPDTVPPTTGRTAYRVVQEGLTNARKHAAGAPVRVTVRGGPGEKLEIEIRNPLPASQTGPLLPGTGTGLVGLTERVRLAGGRLDHEASDGQFRLYAQLPWPA